MGGGGIVVKSHPSNDPRPPHSFHACYITNYIICHMSYFRGPASRARVTSPRRGTLGQFRMEAAIVRHGNILNKEMLYYNQCLD